MNRPDWDTYFMDLAKVVSSRSNCLRRQVGAVIAVDRRVISTGYNGTPRGTRNCHEGGCPRCAGQVISGSGLMDCLCCHAEENSIVQAAYHGISVATGTLYTTLSPCLICTKMIINSGLVRVVHGPNYPMSNRSFRLLKEAGVRYRRKEDVLHDGANPIPINSVDLSGA